MKWWKFVYIALLLLRANGIGVTPKCTSGQTPLSSPHQSGEFVNCGSERYHVAACPSPMYSCDPVTSFCCPTTSQKFKSEFSPFPAMLLPSCQKLTGVTLDQRNLPCQSNQNCPNSTRCQMGQCCRDLCPTGRIPHYAPDGHIATSCLATEKNTCPTGFTCHSGICCGPAGECPRGAKFFRNLNDDRPTTCRPGDLDSCPKGAICRQTDLGTHICCSGSTGFLNDEPTEFSCPISGVPYPSTTAPQICQTDNIFGSCPLGSVCQPSNVLGTAICCATGLLAAFTPPPTNLVRVQRDDPAFTCPRSTQQPAQGLSSGQNIFCLSAGANSGCPAGAICQSAANSPGMLICCFEAALQATNIPMCPTGMLAQPAIVGYVPCDLFALGQCATGFQCTAAVNAATSGVQALCCSTTTTIPRLLCPAQQTLYSENGNPRYCSISQVAPCPAGYVCVESLGAPGVFICCSTPTTTTCPSGFVPATDASGNSIFCSQSDISVCPGYSQCLQAQNRPSTFICCRSSLSPRVCPGNQNALLRPNNQLEYCTGPGSACSDRQYTCQLSLILSQWVCCGNRVGVAVCADGRETYNQQIGQTYTCDPLAFPTQCPTGFECSLSNLPSVSVCCRQMVLTPTIRPPLDQPTCPAGWSAFDDGSGANRLCEGAKDMRCPTGFSCTQSSVPMVFLCCRIARNLQCPAGFATYLLNNNPRLCTTRNSNSCPSGYSCHQSSLDGINICCQPQGIMPLAQQPTAAGTKTYTLTCVDGVRPAYIGSNIRYCSRIGSADHCPAGFYCSTSNKPGLNICCSANRQTSQRAKSFSALLREESSVCGPTAVPYFPEDNPSHALDCSDDPEICPQDFVCQPSLTNSKMFCCQEARCPSGSTSAACTDDHDCHSYEKCTKSFNMPGVSICCSATNSYSSIDLKPTQLPMTTDAKCLGRATLLVGGHAVSCSDNSGCRQGYECSTHTTSKEALCCQPEGMANFCPDSRAVYRDPVTDVPLGCRPDSSNSCPFNHVCKTTITRASFCCSHIPFCPSRRQPQLNPTSNQAKRCAGYGCDAGYECIPSTVPRVYVCCSQQLSRHFDSPPPGGDYVLPPPTSDDDGEEDWVVLEG